MLERWLQEVFDVPTVIMLADDSKFLHNRKYSIEDVRRFSALNAKDLIAFGFNPARTFIFSGLDFQGKAFYANSLRLARCLSVAEVQANLHFNLESDNVGQFHYFARQSAGFFPGSFPEILGKGVQQAPLPSLSVIGTDIDPYFWIPRKYAEDIGEQTPSFIYTSLLSSLDPSVAGKMAASSPTSAIFLSDSEEQVKEKFHRSVTKLGETPAGARGPILQFLRFFLEDDNEMEAITKNIHQNNTSDKELGDRALHALQQFLHEFRIRRSIVTDEVLDNFMTVRLIPF